MDYITGSAKDIPIQIGAGISKGTGRIGKKKEVYNYV